MPSEHRRDALLMKEAIRDPQWQSVAISAISGPSGTISGSQRQSEAISGPSGAISNPHTSCVLERPIITSISGPSGTISGHPRTCVLERPIITSVLCKSRREQSAVLRPTPANPSTGCVNDGCVNDERRRTAATALPLGIVLGRWTRDGAKSSLIIWWKNGEWGCESARMASLIWSSSNRAGSSGLSST